MADSGESFLAEIWGKISANLGTKLISVGVAIVLWGIVLGSRNVEVTKEVPLEVITPSDIIPSNEIPEKIAFRLSGPKAFLRSIIDRKEEPIRVNLAGAKPALVTYRFFSDNIRVPIGVKVLSINPAAILIKLEYLKRREVPIRIETRGNLPEGYQIVRTEIKPDKIMIKGAESRIAGISEITTVPIELSDLKKTLDKEVSLDISRYNIQFEGDLPHVLMEVEPTSANFRIKNVDIRVISPYKVLLDEKTVNVLVRASAKDAHAMSRSDVSAWVDLSGKDRGKYEMPVRVTLPRNVSLVRVIPDRVNITLY